jgi:lipopolysaccharide/colanic/teichoic acid biosynthesis glycosyltransferase
MMKEEYEQVVDSLEKKKLTFFFKRVMDIVAALIMSIILSPMLLIISLLILFSSGLPVFFKQKRVGKNGCLFEIIKFRTMGNNTETVDGITMINDTRITKVGSLLRKYRLDEFPQLFNILKGDMSFVGPRPDMPKYYKKDDYGYKCLLLVKPGVTGEATLKYKGEDTILALSENPERTYEEEVFPEKVKMNINYIRKITLLNDFNIIIKTVYYVFLVRSDKSSISINSEVKVSINE